MLRGPLLLPFSRHTSRPCETRWTKSENMTLQIYIIFLLVRPVFWLFLFFGGLYICDCQLVGLFSSSQGAWLAHTGTGCRPGLSGCCRLRSAQNRPRGWTSREGSLPCIRTHVPPSRAASSSSCWWSFVADWLKRGFQMSFLVGFGL